MDNVNWFNEVINKYSESFTQQLYNLLNELYELGGNATTLLTNILTNPQVNSSHIEDMTKKVLAIGSSPVETSDYARNLKNTISDFFSSESQLEILNKLILRASNYAHRVALFIISGEKTIGWLAWGFSPESAGTIGRKKIDINYSYRSIIYQVRDYSQSFRGKPESNADNVRLYQDLGGLIPNEIACMPLVTKGRVSAVLYLDQAGNQETIPELTELEIEVIMAGMMIDLIPLRKAYPKPSFQKAQPPAASVSYGFQTTAPQTSFSSLPFQTKPSPAVQPSQNLPFQQQQPVQTPAPQFAKPWEQSQFAKPEPAPGLPPFESGTPEFKPVVLPGASETTTAPPRTGTYGMSPQTSQPSIELKPPIGFDPLAEPTRFAQQSNVIQMPGIAPKPAEKEARQAHDEAKRFARLLILEIKLYNEDKVMEGRKNRNLYSLLKEEINRSREVYNERINKEIRDTTSYFDDELINILAGGERSALGI